MGMEMYDKICRLVEADIEELLSKGPLTPQDYPCLGEAIDIVKDVKKIKMMKMEEGEMMPEEDMRSYGMSGYRMPRYNMRMSNERGGSQEGSYDSYAYDDMTRDGSYENMGSNYNPNRSPRTGRYTSNDASYHDMDGSMKKDLEELLNRAKDDHDRMLIMRLLGKIDK